MGDPPAPKEKKETSADSKDVGTCYERGSRAKEWEITFPEVERFPYLKYVKELSKRWKPLIHLVDFMEVGKAPLAWPYESPDEQTMRWEKTNITYIEYRPEIKPAHTSITTASAFRETLSGLPLPGLEDPPLRLFIVEDLSREVIEALGDRFDIDPHFFREHIEDYVWFNTQDKMAMPTNLTSTLRHRQWFRMRNIRLRYHESKKSLEKAQEETKKWNIFRRADDDRNNWEHMDKLDAKVSIMRTRTTIWVGKDKKGDGGTVGIVLLDPTVTAGTPLWYDRANWLPPTSMEAVNTSKETPPALSIDLSKSWYKDIVQLTEAYPWYEAAEEHTIEPQVLTAPAIHTICAEWFVVCEYIKSRLVQIEWEIQMPGVFRSKANEIDSSLVRLHLWRRLLPVFREMVTETLDQALPAATRLAPALKSGKEDHGTEEAFADIKCDFTRIHEALKELQKRVDRLTSNVTSEISIEDSRLGLEENQSLARLTWLATTFIPLTFVSGLFSMNEDITELKYTYGWYFAAAIPFTIFVLAIGYKVGGGVLGGVLGEGLKGKAAKRKQEEKEKEYYQKT